MTPTLWRIVLLLVACQFYNPGISQTPSAYPANAETNKPLSVILDSLKKSYAEQGFKIIKEAPLSMLSDIEIAVLLPLNKDKWYRFVFIGDRYAQGNELRLYDHSNRQVAFLKSHWDDSTIHMTQCNFRARESDYHLLKPTQISQWKKKLKAYLVLMEKI